MIGIRRRIDLHRPTRNTFDEPPTMKRFTFAAATVSTLFAASALAGNTGTGDAMHGLQPALSSAPLPVQRAAADDEVMPAGTVGGPGLALMSAKILTCELEGPGYVNNGVLLMKDGLIEAVGRRSEIEIPGDYEIVDVGERWLMPGMIDLHAHVGGTFDINDMVYQANPGVRASTAVIPANPQLRRSIAAGVTTVLFIPGSGTNVGGQGVLMKTGPKTYEGAVVRNPGSLKIAQWGNPERWAIGVGKSHHGYIIRGTLARGRSYWRSWKNFESGGAPEPYVDPQWEIFRYLFDGEAQVSVHTQVHQVVMSTIDIIKREMGLDVFIDHGTFDGWKAGGEAYKHGVNAIVGPRNVSMPERGLIGWTGDNPERVQGCAAGYWEMGHRMIGFNTDSPVIPQEELPLQAAIAVRHGFPDDGLQAVRGLTIVPAVTIGMGDRLGSLEAGKDADIVVISGHPADPRSGVDAVYVNGELMYDASERRLW